MLCLAKTLHNRRINDLEEHLPGALFALIPDVCAPSTSARLGLLRLSLPRRTPPGGPRPSATTAGSARQATSPSTEFRRPAVLGRFATSLLRLDEIVDPGHPGDRCSLASGWVSAVLELHLACEPCGWKEANQQGSARANEMGVPPALPGRQSNFENSGSIPPAVAFVFAEAHCLASLVPL
jgi:hypothetical protein